MYDLFLLHYQYIIFLVYLKMWESHAITMMNEIKEMFELRTIDVPLLYTSDFNHIFVIYKKYEYNAQFQCHHS